MHTAKLLTRVAEAAGLRAGLLLERLQHTPTPRVWCLTGPPAAGKGTYAAMLSRWTGMPVIGVGELLRNSLDATQQKEVVDRGELLPDGFITQLVARELHARGRGGAILDGYPRTLPQAQDLAVIADVQQVLNLRMPDQALLEKSLARRSCTRCGRVYSLRAVSMPAMEQRPALHLPAILPSAGCSQHLATRADDHPAAVLRRLEVHKEQAAPIEAFFGAAGVLQHVDIVGGVDHMRGVLLNAMRLAPAGQQPQALLQSVFA